MNEFKKVIFSQRGGGIFKPLCQQCVQNCGSSMVRTGISYSTSTSLFSQNFNSRLKSAAKSFCKKIDIISQLLSKQCNLVIAQRIRRSYQILLLYRNIYGEHLLKEKVASQLNKIRKKPLIALLSASIFNWDKERVSDEEIKKCYKEVAAVARLVRSSQLHTANPTHDWEQIVDKDTFKVWRHQLPNSELYEYRVLGHFKDIPARAFYNTQVDVSYWKDWDTQTIDVNVVDKDAKTGSEVIYWLYKFPYPMYPREYVYVRRCMIDKNKNSMVITARATNHPNCPLNSSSVRMETYTSQMVITPYSGFDENGFSYVMSYSDDPQTNFPPMWYNYVASSGCHEFLERIHRAALKKHEKTAEMTSNRIDQGTSLYPGMVHQ